VDENKLRILRKVGYRFPPTCGRCKHGIFPQNQWGTCGIHKYEHQKHTGPARALSIHMLGSCPQFESQGVSLGAYQEFLQEGIKKDPISS
jgi:hypothetical protein